MPFNWNKLSRKGKQGCKDSNVVHSWLRPPSSGSGSGSGSGGEGVWTMPAQQRGFEGGSSWDSSRRSVEAAPDVIMRSSGPRLGLNKQSLSTPVSRTPSFTDPCKGQPLPLPCFPPGSCSGSSARESSSLQLPVGEYHHPRHFASLPLPLPNQLLRAEAVELDGATSGYGSGSTSSVSSLSSADVPDQWTGRGATRVPGFTPVAEGETPTHSYANSVMPLQTVPSTRQNKRGSKNDLPVTNNPVKGSKFTPIGPQRAYSAISGISHQQDQAQGTVPSSSAPSSSMSSPTLSPRRISSSEQSPSSGIAVSRSSQRSSELGMISSGQLSVQGSGHSSATGDSTLQMFWQQGKSSPEISPLPSPRKKTLSPLTANQVGTISPRHQRRSGFDLDSATNWLEDSRAAGHPLPLPPLPRSASSPYTSPSIPSSPTSRQLHASARAESPMSPSTRWQKGKLLGCGTFGNVYKGFSDSGTFCAMKEVLISDDPRSKECVRQLAQEIHMLSHLRHPNIVQYFGSETLEDRMFIYLEYVSGGSIHKLLQEYGQFKEPVIRSYTRQILQGLVYLHGMNKVHRDIKGANILVDTNGQVKLADFGMAKHINAHSMPLSFKGSPYWMAPEVIRNKNGYNCPVDIWSLGCTVIEMATAKPPWSQFEGVAAMFKIGNTLEIPSIPVFLSKDGQEFVRLCLRRNASERPTAAELLEHPFVRSAMDTVRPEEAIENCETSTPISPGMHSLVSETEMVNSHELAASGRLQSRASDHLNWAYGRPSSSARSPSSSPRIVAHNASSHFSTSPISTPLISSGSSTPRASDLKNEHHWGLPPVCASLDSPRSGSFRSPQGDILGNALDRVQREVEDRFQMHYGEKWKARAPS